MEYLEPVNSPGLNQKSYVEKKLLKKSRVETAEKLDRMISASSVLTVQKIIINQDLFAMNHLKESERRLFRNAQKDADLTRH